MHWHWYVNITLIAPCKTNQDFTYSTGHVSGEGGFTRDINNLLFMSLVLLKYFKCETKKKMEFITRNGKTRFYAGVTRTSPWVNYH